MTALRANADKIAAGSPSPESISIQMYQNNDFVLAVTALAILLAGFSIFSSISLALTHFRGDQYQDQAMSRVMGLILLLALSGLQIAHFSWLYLDQAWVATLPYRMTLFAVAPAFFLFSQPLLYPQTLPPIRPALMGHAVPVVISPLLPDDLALPLAFMVGAG